jgi:hypothetical protein
MKHITVTRRGEKLTIIAPADKQMSINEGTLARGILTIGEYGPSGIRIATFAEWDEAIFDAEDHGYTVIQQNPS